MNQNVRFFAAPTCADRPPIEEVVVFVKYDVFELCLGSLAILLPHRSSDEVVPLPMHRFLYVRTIESQAIFSSNIAFTGSLSIFHSAWHLNLSICAFSLRQISKISHLLGIFFSFTRALAPAASQMTRHILSQLFRFIAIQ